MQGRTYFTILGSLIVQLLGTIFLRLGKIDLTTLVFLILMTLGTIIFIMGTKRTSLTIAVLTFCLSFANIVHLALDTLSAWLVIMLCLAAAGFFLTLDRLSLKRQEDEQLPPVKLPPEEPKVVVYEQKKRGRPKGSKNKPK